MAYVEVEGVRVAFQLDDFADPWRLRSVVHLQHGYARHSGFWRAWVPYFARDYRVLRPDMRGCGNSGWDSTLTMDHLVNDVVQLWDSLGVERVHYVGESLGGILGMFLAARHPDRFLSLALISTPLFIAPSSGQASALDYVDWPTALRELGLRGWWLRSREVLGELSGDSAEDQYFADEISKTPLEVAIAYAIFLDGLDARTEAKNVAAPTMILAPSKSAHTSNAQQQQMAEALRGSTLRTYPGLGHGMFYAHPDTLATDVRDYIRTLDQ